MQGDCVIPATAGTTARGCSAKALNMPPSGKGCHDSPLESPAPGRSRVSTPSWQQPRSLQTDRLWWARPCTTHLKILAKNERIFQSHGITVGIGIAIAIAIENCA